MLRSLSCLETELLGADRLELLTRIYEGCISYLETAKYSLSRNDIPGFCNGILKAQDCVVHLIQTLDYSVNEELCSQLHKVYDAVLFFTTEANLKRDATKIDVAINCIRKLLDGYRELAEKLSNSDENNQESFDRIEFKFDLSN